MSNERRRAIEEKAKEAARKFQMMPEAVLYYTLRGLLFDFEREIIESCARLCREQGDYRATTRGQGAATSYLLEEQILALLPPDAATNGREGAGDGD